ncbi:hypothetical protein BSFP_066900 [Burkholderia stabilis]|uniref:Uncharacterized protein n=1 Tax=Burkholderia stabilis TaxID=95485 RepID=A0A1Y1C1B5_9BURK|nr:hypothetical protein BSFP_066900 [Burkholderia stabilis]
MSQGITRGIAYVDNYRLTLPAIAQTYWQARFPAIDIVVTASRQVGIDMSSTLEMPSGKRYPGAHP